MSGHTLTGFVARLTHIPDRVPIKHRRMYSVGVAGGGFAGLTHALFIPLFALLRVPLMAYFNMASVVIFIVAVTIIVKFEAYTLALTLGIAEFIIHQVLAVLSIGWAAGFQHLLLSSTIACFLIVPPDEIRIAIGLGLANVASFVGIFLLLRPLQPLYPIPESLSEALQLANLLITFFIVIVMSYLFIHYVKQAEDKADREFERAEALLHNILPASIAERLKADSSAIADGFDAVSVLFADIVDFTTLSARLSATEVVGLLNGLFSRFDAVAGRLGLEKIKTIGDAYMVAAGIPERRDGHARLIAEFALDIQKEISAFNAERGDSIRMRIGINSGPVVAGVIGKKKFIYDLWGDAVNTASRMESHGLPGMIQVTRDSYELLKDEYEFEDRGWIEVKGKGSIETFLLLGRKAAA
jgi:adenylate cyclase